jgi:hypothetical protein
MRKTESLKAFCVWLANPASYMESMIAKRRSTERETVTRVPVNCFTEQIERMENLFLPDSSCINWPNRTQV